MNIAKKEIECKDNNNENVWAMIERRLWYKLNR